MPSFFRNYDFNILVLFRPLPGPRKRQSSQHSDPKPHSNRPSTVVRAHRPSPQNLHNDRGKAVRSREKKEQSKGREEKVNVTVFRMKAGPEEMAQGLKCTCCSSQVRSQHHMGQLTTSCTSSSGSPIPLLVSAGSCTPVAYRNTLTRTHTNNKRTKLFLRFILCKWMFCLHLHSRATLCIELHRATVTVVSIMRLLGTEL
jgi:hypothetical protein